MTSSISSLNRAVLNERDHHANRDGAHESPVTVLQIGEGNFLRGFFDWMIHECREQGLYAGGIAVTQPRPSGKAKIEALAAQDGLYTLVTRGIENGERIERAQIVTSIAEAFDPYGDWKRFVALAESPSLRFVVSNTTEAGLAYRPEPLEEGKPIQSFPGKIAYLLYRRFVALGGGKAKGLIFLPCELLERNGDELKRCVLRYAEDWGYPESFREWVLTGNRFLNSLVDRIVTGHPGEQARSWFEEWGYEDAMLDTAEPYHFWAIEAEPELDDEFPLRAAGLNVHWVADLKPYQLRKVRILNGAHTLMTPLALLHGVSIVRDVMQHPRFGAFVKEAVEREIVPAIPLPQDELTAYAATVYERFLNPFIDHRLADIAMNGLSKFKVRLLPTLLHYADRGESLPANIVLAFSALLRYCQAEKKDGAYVGWTLDGTAYEIRDDGEALAAIAAIWSAEQPIAVTVERLLGLSDVWGIDLSSVKNLAEWVVRDLEKMEAGFDE
ncbi:tagaturonate reductase [Cohnella suwonensis]|uniref:Tagaturonate reductase n=1 Tax=Cohnella suwonensis TaxID=696072 RepID=A0ABW0M0Z7_9BACL